MRARNAQSPSSLGVGWWALASGYSFVQKRRIKAQNTSMWCTFVCACFDEDEHELASLAQRKYSIDRLM